MVIHINKKPFYFFFNEIIYFTYFLKCEKVHSQSDKHASNLYAVSRIKFLNLRSCGQTTLHFFAFLTVDFS